MMHDRVSDHLVGRTVLVLALGVTLQLVAAPARAGSPPPATRPSPSAPPAPGVTADLSPRRAAEVRRQLAAAPPVRPSDALGRIEIGRVGVSAPILEGVDDATIRRAVGHFPETPGLGQPGNVALAAHRTTDFYGLRHIRLGDVITVSSAAGATTYVVDALWVVRPKDVWVLDATTGRALTLVTCYPFDYPGHAPERFVVRAHAAGSG